MFLFLIFFFKQKTAYEMRISDWSSDVCSSDLFRHRRVDFRLGVEAADGEPDRAARPRLREAQGREAVGRRHRRRGAGRAGGDREARHGQIGRATRREGECQYVLTPVVADTLKKKKVISMLNLS